MLHSEAVKMGNLSLSCQNGLPSYGCCACADDLKLTTEDLPTRSDDVSQPSTPGKLQPTLLEARESNADIVSMIQAEISGNNEYIVEMSPEKQVRPTPNSTLKLYLIVEYSTTLRKGFVISLSVQGYSGSSRPRDGVTYFGVKTNEGGDESEVSDVEIPCTNAEVGKKFSGRHFRIRFDEVADTYFIKDLGKGLGTFLKLDSFFVLPLQTLVHIGDSFLVLTLITLPHSNHPTRLRIKAYSSTSTGEIFYFNSHDLPDNQVRVGRHQACEVCLEDGLISKVQFSISFEGEGRWVLTDGDRIHSRPSTNGTWLYLSQERDIVDGMKFKVCGTVFQAALSR